MIVEKAGIALNAFDLEEEPKTFEETYFHPDADREMKWHFQESVAPVINDVTFLIILITMLTWNLKAKVVDIETAFLHGDLKERIYMEIPKVMKAEDNECLILNKTIYRLAQSARKLYNKLVSALKDCGDNTSSVDPCLWIKYFNQGIVLIAIYVDDDWNGFRY